MILEFVSALANKFTPTRKFTTVSIVIIRRIILKTYLATGDERFLRHSMKVCNPMQSVVDNLPYRDTYTITHICYRNSNIQMAQDIA